MLRLESDASQVGLMKGPTYFPRILLLGSILIFHCQLTTGADEISDADRPIPLVPVEGVLKQQGKLPCDIRVPTRDDRLHMVLWFRDNGEPIYRYDVRSKPLSEAKRWSDVGERVYFQAMSEPAHLLISNLRLEDEGVYICRVDFKNSPTRNLRINLTIIVPPDKPVIYDANGVTSQNIGPYNEGSDLLLTCEVYGGRPKPKVSWWLENAMIDDSWVDRKDGVLVNHLKYSPLQRHHLNARFVCLASNTNQTLPQTTVGILNLNLRPLSVSITTKDTNLLAEKRYDIECVSSGSRPPATITWWKNSRQIKKSPQTPNPDDKNMTKSILNLIPTVDDDGKILTCRSENPWIPASALEDRWRLNVHYSPRVTMQLGSHLVPDDIKEGVDVFFECIVKSNPAYIRLSWFHEDRELRHNVSQRIIMSNTRLVLQKVSRHSAGGYYCSAYNSEGLTQSNIVQLRVKYVPICKSKTEELIGAMRHETVVVRCEMAADPPAVQFFWTFNNSGMEVSSILNSRFSSSGTVSLFNYTPVADDQFGTLSCWGANPIGQGTSEPCRFQIVQAGKPFPPKNCSIYNETEDGVTIGCAEGFNGGLPQHFVLEVLEDTQAKKIRFNGTATMPLFTVDALEPGVPFKFILYASNIKGSSEPVIIDGITFRGVAKYTTGPTVTGDLSPLHFILVIITIFLLVLLTITIIAIWKRSRRKKPPIVKAAVIRRESDAVAEATPTKVEGGGEEIGNPDVIPSKNGGLRGFIRIHKTPPARRRKKNLEVKHNGETVALTQETPESEPPPHGNRNGSHRLLQSSSTASTHPPRESRI